MEETQQTPNQNPITPPPITTYPMTQPAPTSITPWILISLIVILIVVASYVGYQNYQLKKQIITLQPQGTPKPTVNSSLPPQASNIPSPSWTYTGKTFSVSLPSTWKQDTDYQASPQNTEEIRYTTERETNQQSGGDFTPGFADITIKAGSEMETGFFELASEPLNSITVDNYSAKQGSGYVGIAGSVFVIKTIVVTPKKVAYTITLSTQDEKLKPIFIQEYNQMLASIKLTN